MASGRRCKRRQFLKGSALLVGGGLVTLSAMAAAVLGGAQLFDAYLDLQPSDREKELFDPDLWPQIEERAKKAGPSKPLPSRVYDGVGEVILESRPEEQNPKNLAGLGLRYGYGWGHSHHDSLNVERLAKGEYVVPELGYANWVHSLGSTTRTVHHITGMIDGKEQYSGGVAYGTLKRFAGTSGMLMLPGLPAAERENLLKILTWEADWQITEGGFWSMGMIEGVAAAAQNGKPLVPQHQAPVALPEGPSIFFDLYEALGAVVPGGPSAGGPPHGRHQLCGPRGNGGLDQSRPAERTDPGRMISVLCWGIV